MSMKPTQPKGNKHIDAIRNQGLPFLYLIIALFALRWTIVEPYVVPTASMEPTLKKGDRLYALKCMYDVRFPFTEKILFRTGDVKRGDVILFRAPHDPAVIYVKRAVGLPGDKISFRDGILFVNGVEQKKDPTDDREIMSDIDRQETKTLFIEQLGPKKHWVILDRSKDRSYAEQESSHRNYMEKTVPPGHLFASGDNRDESFDSRGWGFVPMENLKGKAMFIWYSSHQPVDLVHNPYVTWPEWIIGTVRNFLEPRPERVGIPIR